MLENAYALTVGIAGYRNIRPLRKTLADAQDVFDLLTDENYCGYLKSNVTLLTEEAATRAAILAALDSLAAKANVQSTVFIFMACHGGRLTSGPFQGQYILPVEVENTNEETFYRTAISGKLFTEKLGNIKAAKLIVILDCCHSGGIGQPRQVDALALSRGLSEEFYTQLARGRGRVIMGSASENEVAWELAADRNGLFTKHLLAGLRGSALGSDTFIRVFELYDYVQQQVVKEQPKQNPLFKAEAHDNFPVALRLGGKRSANSSCSSASAVPLSAEELLEPLSRLQRGEFEELLFRLRMPQGTRPARELTQRERALAVIQWASEEESGVKLDGLHAALQKVLGSRR